jgi:hypothetical protein
VTGHYLKKPIVVNTDTEQLCVLLGHRNVPAATKVLTCSAALFPHCRYWIKQRAKLISFSEAQGTWSIPGPESFSEDSYHVGVAMTLLGQCYSNAETVAVQVRKRLGASLSAKDVTPPDDARFSEWKVSSGYKVGWPAEICVALAGVVVSTTEPMVSNINSTHTGLCPIGSMAAYHNWDDFTMVIYQAYRMVTEHSHSSTIRFAMTSLPAFGQ